MANIFTRTEIIIGKDNQQKIRSKKIAVFGLGGVGSYALEGLIRAGIEHIDIFDKDVVDITNINRQLIATMDTIGKDKVEVAKTRILSINPSVDVKTYKIFYDESNSNKYPLNEYDYVVDAIDSVKSKIELIKNAKDSNTEIISCMGTGNKIDPSLLKIEDISKTSMCPLAKVIRKELKNLGIKKLKVLYSTEEPSDPYMGDDGVVQGSISFVPSVAGLMISGEIIRDIINKD